MGDAKCEKACDDYRVDVTAAVLMNSAVAFRPAAQAQGLRRGLTVAAYDIQGTVASADVVVFSKSWCPFCDKTKRVFRNLEARRRARARARLPFTLTSGRRDDRRARPDGRGRRDPGGPRGDDGPAHGALRLHQGCVPAFAVLFRPSRPAQARTSAATTTRSRRSRRASSRRCSASEGRPPAPASRAA